jgi:ABC-2 type transport system permease protein
MTAYYLKLEIGRMVRDPRFLTLAVAAPIGFYLLFATLFGGQAGPPGTLNARAEIMVAMAAYGAIWAVLSTTGPCIASERESGWATQLRTLPISAGRVLASKVVASVVVALPAIVLVCATAAAVKGVRLSSAQWAVLIGAMWLGTVPFAALGLFLGYAISADASFVLSYGCYVAMSAIGGLWVPPAVLPPGMRTAAQWLPTNRLADLGWQVAGGAAIRLSSVAVLAAWTLGLGVLALAAYGRRRLR